VHYWNQPNFQGLLQIADHLGSQAQLRSLAEYCRLREQGLRSKALEALDRFLQDSRSWESSSKQEACLTILEVHSRTPKVHQFLSQPLREQFIVPVLETWETAEPENYSAVRWLGILRNDAERLRHALALRPDDVPVRKRLTEWHLSDVEHATHHLVESRLLGDLDETKRSLATARNLVEAAPDPVPFKYMSSEISLHEQMLRDWESYASLPEGSFPEWCAGRNRSYSWPTIVYY
jgi:hypothetical protein